ncbi:MAG: efflux RND transporter periplasmic adaptor subunit [Wenzhouxiangella sp.]
MMAGIYRAGWLLASLLVVAACSSGPDEETTERRTSVTVSWPESRQLQQLERSVGRLEAVSAPGVAAETAGRVVSISVDAGEFVDAGALLLRLDAESQRHAVSAAEAELRRLAAMLANQQVQVERLRGLAQRQSVAQDQLDQAETQVSVYAAQMDEARARLSQAQLDLARTEVLSPVTGQVQRRLVSVGDVVSSGRGLFEIVAVDALQAVLPLPEHLQDAVSIGQSVYLSIPARPEQRLELAVSDIRPVVGPGSRAIELLVNLDNPGQWRAGGSVVADVVMARRDSLVIPSQALVRRPAGEVVFVYDGDGRVHQHQVYTGLRGPGWIEIREGLRADQAVVVDGAGFLADGAAVEVREWLALMEEARP